MLTYKELKRPWRYMGLWIFGVCTQMNDNSATTGPACPGRLGSILLDDRHKHRKAPLPTSIAGDRLPQFKDRWLKNTDPRAGKVYPWRSHSHPTHPVQLRAPDPWGTGLRTWGLGRPFPGQSLAAGTAATAPPPQCLCSPYLGCWPRSDQAPAAGLRPPASAGPKQLRF